MNKRILNGTLCLLIMGKLSFANAQENINLYKDIIPTELNSKYDFLSNGNEIENIVRIYEIINPFCGMIKTNNCMDFNRIVSYKRNRETDYSTEINK